MRVGGGAARVLIVDDHTDIRESLAEVLQEEGYSTATASNGLEALVYLHRNPPPHLILLNTIMPVMDGKEFREQQKRVPQLAHIPVAVISGADSTEVEATFGDTAARFKKPVDLAALLATLAQYVQPSS